VTVEYRWLEGQYDRLPALMADLVRRRMAVIVADTGPVSRAAKGAIKGERLAAGLAISNERDRYGTHLKIIDPDVEPLITLGSDRADEIERKAHRIAVARALGLIGLSEMAFELSLPPDVDSADKFLRPSEISRLRSSRPDRSARATQQLRERRLEHFQHGSRHYEGRRIRFELADTGSALPFNEITIRQGVDRELLRDLAGTSHEFADNLDARLQSYAAREDIKMESDGNLTSLTYGNVLFSDLRLTRLGR
jgi:hypothetical protein